MSIEDDLFSHTALFARKLKKLCSPMASYFGVTEVMLMYVTNEHRIINIHTHESWMEHCMREKYFLTDPHIANPDRMKTGFVICSQSQIDEYTEGLLKDGGDNYDLNHSISYTKKLTEGYLALSFDTTAKNKNMTNKAIQNQECFKLFAKYLLSEMDPIFKKIGNSSIDIKALKGDNLNKQSVFFDEPSLDQKANFLTSINALDETANIRLSPQERKCVYHYFQGKTATDTAKVMGLSSLTVESYINNVKTKLNLGHKKDLINNSDILSIIGVKV